MTLEKMLLPELVALIQKHEVIAEKNNIVALKTTTMGSEGMSRNRGGFY